MEYVTELGLAGGIPIFAATAGVARPEEAAEKGGGSQGAKPGPDWVRGTEGEPETVEEAWAAMVPDVPPSVIPPTDVALEM